jgi:uncharacterized protein YndB with AHSA1/START domain
MPDRDLTISRSFNAPPERLFRAWTTPDELKQWWGPHGMTTPICEIDARPGGIFRTVMRDASGTEYPNTGVFTAVDRPRRLVFSEETTEAPFAGAFAAITFEDQGGRTLLTAHWRHQSAADRDAHERMGFHDGWGQMFDRLGAFLANRP